MIAVLVAGIASFAGAALDGAAQAQSEEDTSTALDPTVEAALAELPEGSGEIIRARLLPELRTHVPEWAADVGEGGVIDARPVVQLQTVQWAGGVDARPQPEGSGDAAELREGSGEAAAEGRIGEAVSTTPYLDRFRFANEELYFRIEILGSDAAECVLTVGGPISTEYGPAIPAQGFATSLGFFDAVYPIRDEGRTLIRTDTGRPYWSLKTLQERDINRSYEVTYAQDEFRARVHRVNNGRERQYTRYIASNTYDAFSWVYDLRTQPLDEGSVYVYWIFDGWKLSRMTLRITRHEQVLTGLGYIEGARIEMYREVLDSHEPLPWAVHVTDLTPVYSALQEPYLVGVGHISVDDRRLPLGIELQTSFGQIRMYLQRWQPPG